jgi:TRAP-type C4-dicarboxylate transport system permease small subunit
MSQTPHAPRLIERLQQVQLGLAAAALCVMMLGTVLDVLARYLFNKPLRISYDLVGCMLVIYVFNGLAGVFYQRRNIVIDLIDVLVGPRFIGFLTILTDLISVGCLGIFLWAMTQPAWQAYDYGDRMLELGLPLWVLWAFAIAGLAGTILCTLSVLMARVWSGWTGECR